MAFNAPEKIAGSPEYFDALTDAKLADADANREERLGRHAGAARLRKQRDAHLARAAGLAPKED